MKKKSRIIATSIASIAMCASLVVGGTFALFTSESEVNISVTSGKVSVKANVVGSSLKTYSTLDGTNNEADETESGWKSSWSNGGFAEVNGADVTLDRITPADGANFNIEITNESNVAIQYKVALSASVNGTTTEEDKTEATEQVNLMDALEVKITAKDGLVKTMKGNELLWSNWTFLEANESLSDTVNIDTMNIDVYMPEADDNNDYQNKGVTITCRVEAVQGNAKMEQPEVGTALAITTADEFVAFANSVNSGATYKGETVELMNNISLAGKDWRPIGTNADGTAKFKGTFEGNYYTVSDLTVNASDEDAYQATGLFGVLNGTLQNLTIRNATINGANSTAVVAGSIFNTGTIDNVHVVHATVTGNHYVGGISGYTYGNVKNCSVTDVTLTAIPNGTAGNYDNGDKVGGIVGYLAEYSWNISGNEVNGVTIKGYRDLGGIVGGGYVKNVKNNTVSNATILVDQGTNYYGKKDVNADYVVGRVLSGTVGDGNVVTGENDIRFVVVEGADAAWLGRAIKADQEVIKIELQADASVNIMANDSTYYFGGANTKKIVIDGNGEHTLTFNYRSGDWQAVGTNNDECVLVLNNVKITNSGRNEGPWDRHDIVFHCAVELTNVTSDKAIALYANSKLDNVTITEDGTNNFNQTVNDVYGLWIAAKGQTVDIDGLNLTAVVAGNNTGRGIKIADQYEDSPAVVTLNIKNATFVTEAKAAIFVSTTAGANINIGAGVDISDVKADTGNHVWVDKTYNNRDKIHVTGGSAIDEL